jgi:hypothetical protein
MVAIMHGFVPGWVIALRGLVPVCGMLMHGFVPMWGMTMRGLVPVCITIMHGFGYSNVCAVMYAVCASPGPGGGHGDAALC